MYTDFKLLNEYLLLKFDFFLSLSKETMKIYLVYNRRIREHFFLNHHIGLILFPSFFFCFKAQLKAANM